MPGLDPGKSFRRKFTGSSPVMTGGFCGAGKGALRIHANLNIFEQPKSRHCERERSNPSWAATQKPTLFFSQGVPDNMSLLDNPFDPAREAALVTGAGNGIGRAIAQALVGEGVRTVFADVNRDTVTAAVKTSPRPDLAVAFVGDLASRDACDALLKGNDPRGAPGESHMTELSRVDAGVTRYELSAGRPGEGRDP
jgi:hypothetical protein